jgi:signal transduction histidine kinase
MVEETALRITTQRLERLLEISRNLTSTHDLPLLFQLIVDVACELTKSQAASILLYDRTSGELRFEAVLDSQMDDLLHMSVPLDSSVAGRIFSNAQPVIIQDATSDSRIYRRIDRQLNFQTRSLIGVPLIVKQEPIGVLEAVNKKDEANYTEDDMAILETLASQAAIAIQNARLLIQLQDANTDLRRLDRMKSDFIAIASHELRTPLGLILGHATFIKDMVSSDLQDQMEVIIRSALRLKTIIEDLATIAHEEEGQSKVRRALFSMKQLISDMGSRFGDIAVKKNIALTFDVPGEDYLTVDGDREKSDISLANLIQNALTFTDPEGQVGIKAEKSGGYVKVFVVDTGIGIPEDDIERIFDRFYQVESHLTRKHGGMGLGLSIAKTMVEMHNGQIWCESKEGTASLFCFMLPTDEQRASAAAKVFKS